MDDTQIASAQIKMNRFFSYGIYQIRHWECGDSSIQFAMKQFKLDSRLPVAQCRFVLYFCLFWFSRIGYNQRQCMPTSLSYVYISIRARHLQSPQYLLLQTKNVIASAVLQHAKCAQLATEWMGNVCAWAIVVSLVVRGMEIVWRTLNACSKATNKKL